MFAYCNNNSVSFIDSLGTRPLLNTGEKETPADYAWSLEQMKKNSPLKEYDKKGVHFFANKDGNGGTIINSYKIRSDEKRQEYVDYLMNDSCYASWFAGSVDGFAFEWYVHNVAYDFYHILYNPQKILQAKDLDVGKTIYADQHDGFSKVMIQVFETLYPDEASSDLAIYENLCK